MKFEALPFPAKRQLQFYITDKKVIKNTESEIL